MPNSRRKTKPSNRPVRCSYVEGGRRCVRNAADATNPPPLCNAHVVLFAEIGKPPRGESMVHDILDDLMSGERVTRTQVEGAIQELFGNFVGGGLGGGGMAQGYYPDIDPQTGRTVHDTSRSPPNTGHFRPPAGFPSPGGIWEQFFGRHAKDYEPPPSPEQLELERAVKQAKTVLGFAESEPIDREKLKARYRELAKRHHPDRGGDEDKMKIINDAVGVIESVLP